MLRSRTAQPQINGVGMSHGHRDLLRPAAPPAAHPITGPLASAGPGQGLSTPLPPAVGLGHAARHGPAQPTPDSPWIPGEPTAPLHPFPSTPGTHQHPSPQLFCPETPFRLPSGPAWSLPAPPWLPRACIKLGCCHLARGDVWGAGGRGGGGSRAEQGEKEGGRDGGMEKAATNNLK